MRRRTVRTIFLSAFLASMGLSTVGPAAEAVPNPVATTDAQYLAYGRVFPDPQGCGVNPPGVDPTAVSPWAKGNVCVAQFLHYDEVITGAAFLQSKHRRFLQVIRLDQAFDNPNFKSAGLPTAVGLDEDGEPEVLSRDRRPLYLFKVTDSRSPIPEPDRKHFIYSLSIHGIERAGLEGGIRAMEDLVTWAACEADPASAPACAAEGPFPKPIVETPTAREVPTAGDVLRGAVIYFMPPNPDGWHRGEVGEGGVFFQRYNGNGVDLNRDWPSVGYTYRPYSPASEPEIKAFADVLRGIRRTTTDGRFAGGIDLHGQLDAVAFSFTLLGAGQRDFRKNFSTVDQGLRAFEDQTARLAWSPYVANAPNNPGPDHPGIFAAADQWGTVVDTIGYQVTGATGDWFESPIGLGAVGIDNEMSLSHLAPNTAYDPINEQMHVDGNKGLIYSQLASMLTEEDSDFAYDPPGRIGYVLNPHRIDSAADARDQNPGYPAQNDVNTLVPCAPGACDGGTFVLDGTAPTIEFDVLGPDRGIFNGGITVTATFPNAQGISGGSLSQLQLQAFVEGQWQTVAGYFNQSSIYLQGGEIVSANDPIPGRWRVRLSSSAALPARVKIDFNPVTAEESPGQAPFSASSMDFFDELNAYIQDPSDKLEAVQVADVLSDPASLDRFDSLVVVNRLGSRAFLTDRLGLSPAEGGAYFQALRGYAERGGNLILTDEALRGLAELGVVLPGQVSSSQPGGRGPVPRYGFSFAGRPNLCTPDSHDPLVRQVCLPGTAGGTARQAVEPAPLGYTPDATLDGAAEAKLTQFFVTRGAWEAGCGKAAPVECTTGILGGGVGLGERHLGSGVIRIAGAMLPDPNFVPGGPRDMRFGLASYALTFSAWQIFLNLLDYQRAEEPPPPQADLSVSKSDSPDPAVVGDPLTYTIDVANGGPDQATGVTVTDVLPGGVAFGAASAGCAEAAGTVTCDVGAVPSGESAQVAIEVTPQSPGTITNAVEVSGAEVDPDPADNADTEATEVLPRRADLSVAKSDSPDPVIVGELLTYTIEVSNAGPQEATGTTLTDDLPDAVSFESATGGCSESGGIVTCDLGTIPSGGSAQVTVEVRPEEPGTLTNEATVGAAEEDPDTSNNSATAVTESICTISGTPGNDTLQGTPGRDVICGFGGDDTLRGLDGHDLLIGGDGADRLFGNAGDDLLRGGPGDDDLKGGDGDDRLFGGPGNDSLNGGPGTDACSVDEDGGTTTDCGG